MYDCLTCPYAHCCDHYDPLNGYSDFCPFGSDEWA